MATFTMNTIAPVDFNSCKNATAVKNAVRAVAFDTLYNAMVAVYGADNVFVVGSNEVAEEKAEKAKKVTGESR